MICLVLNFNDSYIQCLVFSIYINANAILCIQKIRMNTNLHFMYQLPIYYFYKHSKSFCFWFYIYQTFSKYIHKSKWYNLIFFVINICIWYIWLPQPYTYHKLSVLLYVCLYHGNLPIYEIM